MNIIPVIDLQNGVVVSAQQGNRKLYQPIKSKLCSSSSLDDVIKGLLSVYSFKTLYIADLNAITRTNNNQSLIDNTIQKYQGVTFWVDNGKDLTNTLEVSNADYRLIIGSEYQSSENFDVFKRGLQNHILSLDFFPDIGYKGPKILLETPSLWPQQIILMTLDRVGNDLGPNIKKLKHYCETYPQKTFIAAGGVRDLNDLITLQKMGIQHVLVSSALHSGVINTQTIKKLISIAPKKGTEYKL